MRVTWAMRAVSAPPILNNREGVELLMDAIDKSGHTNKIVLGMDVASSEFCVEGKYDLMKKIRKDGDDSPMLSKQELCEFYKGLCKDFPIKSIEDGFDEDDWEGWTAFTKKQWGTMCRL